MTKPLRNLLLSAALIAVPATGFALAEIYMSPPVSHEAAATGLGDLSAYSDIVRDTRNIAARGDLVAAERRIADLETLWDDSESTLRAADRAAWTSVDDAADAAFAALRGHTPDPVKVEATLVNLQDILAHPVAATANGPLRYVEGIAVTDDTGHALPCEDLVGQLRTELGAAAPSAAVADLQSKALERCNADDDARADAFAAQALAQLRG
ncbi:MAG: hypothetical protein CML66_09090 [Rhodobacteraceae bacterium]|nr:hypothetical protein [Paracoccaceae bacterium]